jgi:hypothetical protein
MFGRGIGKRKYMRDREISPDEIFLDSSNLPNFNQGTLEGRLEKPIARGSYIGIGIVVVLVFTGLFAQAAHLQIGLGAKYAARSQLNLLRPAVLFAERGAILDRNGTPLVTNEINADGLVRRIYPIQKKTVRENTTIQISLVSLVLKNLTMLNSQERTALCSLKKMRVVTHFRKAAVFPHKTALTLHYQLMLVRRQLFIMRFSNSLIVFHSKVARAS